MFGNLLAKLFGNRQEEGGTEIPPEVILGNMEQPLESPEDLTNGTLIGYNYMKRMGENDNSMPRRFVKLSKFLQGGYKDGQTQGTPKE